MMQAIQYFGYGGGSTGLKHVEVPIPEVRADEVLLKLEAMSLNPIDWKMQQGVMRPILPLKFPATPGCDVAGEIVKVGSKVTEFKAGDKVVAAISPLIGGALAEYVVAKERLTAIRPPGVSAAEGASLPVAGLTAYQALTGVCGLSLDGTGEKKNILITAASGGVGHYAVQLAKLGNAHVTATCGARNIALVASLGADEVVDYKTPEGAALTSPSGKKYDYVIHGAMGVPWSTFEPNLSRYGAVVDLTPGLSAIWTFALNKLSFSKKRYVPLQMMPNADDLERLLTLLEKKKLKTVVDSRYPLSKAGDAWERITSGHATGKIVVEIPTV